ncbi:hypothetical protein H5410_062371 [Solanum commersonii]|uniref:Uncharacterized protein n=1 Tax=Solanum commersonii TaxID=4109 RepID=A0A9J5WAN6_SOLCO|nr:hypothetical protein H5410_062371 [Solanum commersonii]
MGRKILNMDKRGVPNIRIKTMKILIGNAGMEDKHRKAIESHNYYMYKTSCGQFESKIVVRILTSLGYVSTQKQTPVKSKGCGTRSATLNEYTTEELGIRGLRASWISDREKGGTKMGNKNTLTHILEAETQGHNPLLSFNQAQRPPSGFTPEKNKE